MGPVVAGDVGVLKLTMKVIVNAGVIMAKMFLKHRSYTDFKLVDERND
jgi:hypothetical protein